jgi:RNA-binding protein YhbY
MKKFSIFFIFLCFLSITFGIKTNKSPKNLISNSLLEDMKKLIENKRNAKVAKLEKKNDIKKQEKAKILKQRTRLDHIKLIGNNKIVYLQLENSFLYIGFPLNIHFDFNPLRLQNDLDTLSQENLVFDKDSKISIYPSRKLRKNRLLGSWCTYKDLYSASIKINKDITLSYDEEKKYLHRKSTVDWYKELSKTEISEKTKKVRKKPKKNK